MKKNVGILVSSLNSGGAERAAANLSRDLSGKYNVFLILFDTSEIMYPYKGKLINLNFKSGKNIATRGINAAFLIGRLRFVKVKYKLDVVISFMPGANKYNVLSGTKCKTIISIRNTMSKKNLSLREKKTIIKTGKRADLTVSLSEGVRKDLIEKFEYSPSDVVTVYNSCDARWFKGESEEINKLIDKFDFSKPVIVNVGRLHDQKGQWHLLRAFAIVKKEIPDCKLVIFGKGELESDLKLYSKKLGVEKDTYFMGYVKNHQKFMEKCDAFVFPSLYEGLGNALLEALACEMPIISSDCPCGPREILDPNNTNIICDVHYGEYGILIPNFSDNSFLSDDVFFEESDYCLAEGITQILKNSELKEKYKNQARLRSEFFLPNNVIQQWINLIENL